MKRFILVLPFLFTTSVYAGQGISNTLKVSSGTFLNIQGFGNNSGNFVQGISVVDSSYTVAAPVDIVTGLTVSIATSALTTATAIKVDGSAVTQPISGAVSQSGAWSVSPGTGTYPITIQSGSIANTSFAATQTTDSNLNASVSIKGSSNTVSAAQSGTWTVQPGNTPNTTAWIVQTTTVGVNASTMVVVNAGGVALKVDGSGVTQPVSGTVSVTNLFSGTTVYVVNPTSTTQIGTYTVTPGTGTWSVTGSTVGILSSAITSVTGTLTNATSIVSSTFTTAAYTTAGFTIWPGTSTGITANFEISPDLGTTWILVHAYQNIPDPSNGKVAYQTYPLTTSTTTFRTSVTGMTNFRVRASAWTTGIASVTITVSSIGDPGVQTVNIGQIDGWVPLNGGSNGSLGVGGVTALGASPNSLPLHVGGLATVGVLPSKRGNGTITDKWLTGLGAQTDTLDCPRDLIVKSSTTLTTTTSETVILSSGAASVFNDLTNLIAINTSATAARLDFRSGGGPSGGTIDFALYLPAGDTRGLAPGHIWPQTSSASNWTAQSSASVTDIRLYATYCQSK